MNVGRKADGNRIGRWNCHSCKSSFNVLSGTIFEKTRIELQKWFLAISLIVNTDKSISSHQLSRDLDLNQKTAWYMAMRIRKVMVDNGGLLSGIVDADEADIDGKPAKLGLGTNNSPMVGVIERGIKSTIGVT